jgi:acyl carrier protein
LGNRSGGTKLPACADAVAVDEHGRVRRPQTRLYHSTGLRPASLARRNASLLWGQNMTKDAIQEQLQAVFRDVFDDDELTVNRHSSAADVEGWDSMMHVSLMINVERVFDVKFSTTQVASLKDVGELVDLIESRLAGKAPGGRA